MASSMVDRHRTLPRVATRWQRSLRVRAEVIDAVAIALALIAARQFRFGHAESSIVGFTSVDYWTASLVIGAGWLGSLHAARAYHPDVFGVGSEEFRRVARATFALFGTVAILSMLLKLDVARGYLAFAMPVGIGLLLLGRLLLRRWVVHARADHRLSHHALLLGSTDEVTHAATVMLRLPAAGYDVRAVSVTGLGGDFRLPDGRVVPDIGSFANPVLAAHSVEADTIVIAGGATVADDRVRRIGWQIENSPIRLVLSSSISDVAGPRIHRRSIEGLPLTSVEQPTFTGGRYAVKRAFDVVLSGLTIILLAPLLTAIALAIRLDDGGPMIFRQRRIGINGRVFRMTKFRSMVVDAELLRADLTTDDPTSPLFKMRGDPRITRVGRFLRAYSLDELPQLFDVLRGDMSLVGPRPPLPEEVQRYEAHVHRRLNVKPGVTGPWQVGGRSNLTWSEAVQKDLYYVENWSVIGDVSILLRTIGVVFKRDGAH